MKKVSDVAQTPINKIIFNSQLINTYYSLFYFKLRARVSECLCVFVLLCVSIFESLNLYQPMTCSSILRIHLRNNNIPIHMKDYDS